VLRAGFALNEPKLPHVYLVVWSLVAYAAGVYGRLDVHARIRDKLAIAADGHRVLTTADAYYYATGIEQTVSGLLQGYDRVPTWLDNLLVALGSLVVRLGSVHTSEFAYFFPVFAAPLIVSVVLCWSIVLRLPRVGLIAAVPVALGFSYLNRTSPGQLDTDLLALAIPYLTLAAAVGSLERKSPTLATLTGLLTAISRYAHPGAERVLFACHAALLIYVLVTARNRLGMQLMLCAFLGLVALPVPIRIALVLATHVWLSRTNPSEKTLRVAVGVVGVAALATAATIDVTILGGMRTEDDLTFYDVRREVAELGAISFDTLANRVSGGKVLFVLAVLGALGLFISRPATFVLLPLLVLGTLGAQRSGLRFTIYAVPIAALSLAWLLCAGIDLLRHAWPRKQQWIAWTATGLAIGACAYPAALHASTHELPGSYNAAELTLMEKLREKVKPGDYAIAWWDYGYGLWYYSHVRTLVDGMKQNEDLFVVAEAWFSDSQLEAAQLARLAVESAHHSSDPLAPAIRAVLGKASAQGASPDALLKKLANESVPMPGRSAEIYVFLPAHIASMGRSWARARKVEGIAMRDDRAVGFVDVARARLGLRGKVTLQSGRVLDFDRGLLLGRKGQRGPIASTLTVRGGPGHKQISGEIKNPKGKLHVLHLVDGRSVLVVDNVMLRSVYVQLAIFERPDPRAFAESVLLPNGHVYRVVP
jgi:dolichyl-diphosphooligosaccharide--protein glycosyltransferase/undecaprenyl-diphosphooligosaccharide--protein glycosyltransferase